MALSDYEKQVLAEMEQHLRNADPDLADAMASSLPEEEEVQEPPTRLSPRRIALGAILVTLGLGAILLGVSLGLTVWAILMGVVGFAAMVAGSLYALRPIDGPSTNVDAEPGKNPGPTAPKTRMSGKDRNEIRRQRWEQRGRG